MLPLAQVHHHTPSLSELRQMLQYYFPDFPEGDVRQLHGQLRAVGHSLIELEYFARRLKPQTETIANWIEQRPSRVNLLTYALEVFYDMHWEGVGISPERRQLVKTLRSLCGLVKPPEPAHEGELEEDELEFLGREMEDELDHLLRKLAKRERLKKPGLSSLFTSKGSEGSC
jgi:hypothetical protein